jgi:hypothetical protein
MRTATALVVNVCNGLWVDVRRAGVVSKIIVSARRGCRAGASSLIVGAVVVSNLHVGDAAKKCIQHLCTRRPADGQRRRREKQAEAYGQEKKFHLPLQRNDRSLPDGRRTLRMMAIASSVVEVVQRLVVVGRSVRLGRFVFFFFFKVGFLSFL